MATEIDPELRRLPVYLLLDCSASMSGPPIEAVKEGLKMLLRDLCREPWSQGTVWLSIISFNSTAEQLIPLTEITRVSEPNLVATGQTAMGLALRKLASCIDSDVRQRTESHRGDYRPVVYLLTDGQPTDSDWENAARELRQRKLDSFVACAAGPTADEVLLSKITEKVIRLQDASPESLRAFIRWVSQSIQVRSRSAGLKTKVEEPGLPECARETESGQSLRPKGTSTTL